MEQKSKTQNPLLKNKHNEGQKQLSGSTTISIVKSVTAKIKIKTLNQYRS